MLLKDIKSSSIAWYLKATIVTRELLRIEEETKDYGRTIDIISRVTGYDRRTVYEFETLDDYIYLCPDLKKLYKREAFDLIRAFKYDAKKINAFLKRKVND